MILPEIAEIAARYGRSSLSASRQKMSSYNQTLCRGDRLCLHFDASSLLVRTPHAGQLATWSRCMRLIWQRPSSPSPASETVSSLPAALAWRIDRDLLIHWRHWLALCRHAMNLIRLTGIDADDADAPLLHRWPDRGDLQAARRRPSFRPFQRRGHGRCGSSSQATPRCPAPWGFGAHGPGGSGQALSGAAGH